MRRLAQFFVSTGLKPGDVVSVLLPNCHVFLETYYAAALAGVILNPINHRLSGLEIAFIINDAGAKLVIVHDRFLDRLGEAIKTTPCVCRVILAGAGNLPDLPVETLGYDEALTSQRPWAGGPIPVSDEAVAHLYYTSGTTGKPKGVMLTHKNVTTHALAAIAEVKITDADVWLHAAPMFHLADAWATFAVTWVGGKHVMAPEFDPAEMLKTMETQGVTLSNMVPTMLNLMVKHPRINDFDYRSLRVIMSGGAPIAPETVRSIMAAFGCDYIQTYGMTETSPYLTMSILKDHLKNLPEEDRFEFRSRTGREFLGVELKVVDKSGQEIRPNNQDIGEIVVKGDIVTPGYWNRPEETAKAIKAGWLHTGDLAVIDEEGYVNIVDRKKDMIITGGENVFSIEVENVLYSHPKILEAAVVGIPDEKWGEAVAAAVVPRPGVDISAEEIVSFCKSKIAGYKSPKKVFFLEELPKTGSGKIYKKGIREHFGRSS
ncbi:MAG: long-chain-fatty-acid--CoA ligase [Deltaproteobacteria bacterium]|nr:long-chain-fatty-acid--CoA ligase [Deltaproteobacteria bacterium]